MKTIEFKNKEQFSLKIDKTEFKLTKDEAQKLFDELLKEFCFNSNYLRIVYVDRWVMPSSPTPTIYPSLMVPWCGTCPTTYVGNIYGGTAQLGMH